MTDILDQRFTPDPAAIDSPVGDETVLLHIGEGAYYGLDAVGTRIWALLKEGAAPSEICARIADEYGAPIEVVEADTRRFLESLKDSGIVRAA